ESAPGMPLPRQRSDTEDYFKGASLEVLSAEAPAGRRIPSTLPCPMQDCGLGLCLAPDHSLSPSSYKDRKLFVGMLNKQQTEEDVYRLFEPYGVIEECTVLRGPDGNSKGCAFVKFSTHTEAQSAISALHGSQTMPEALVDEAMKRSQLWSHICQPSGQSLCSARHRRGPIRYKHIFCFSLDPQGASSSLVVKFADTDKERTIRRMQQMVGQFGIFNPAIALPFSTYSSYAHALMQQQAAIMAASHGGYLTPSMAFPATQIHQMGALNINSLQHNPMNPMSSEFHQTLGLSSPPANITTSVPSLVSPLVNGFTGIPHQPNGHPAVEAMYTNGLPPYSTQSPTAADTLQQAFTGEFGDNELMQMFMPFGSVISSKVFMDRATNQSKCFALSANTLQQAPGLITTLRRQAGMAGGELAFSSAFALMGRPRARQTRSQVAVDVERLLLLFTGFVSFDNPASAQAAIQAMNGFQIGMKRLKVQLKRPKDASRPY
ncbi:hypothetical protein JOQ06_005618, partial [Pogonophryne albipinna]